MEVLVEPLFDVREHVVDTVCGLRLKGTDPDMEAIFLAFLEDNNATIAPKMASKSELSASLTLEKDNRSTSAHVPAESHVDGASPATPLRPKQKPKRLRSMRGLRPHGRSVRRRITNDTYLRRLYMPPDSVMRLFPSLSSKLLAMTETRPQRAPPPCLSQDFMLSDPTGRSWRLTCDCKISSSGVLHCRLVGGWSCFCRDNNIAVQDEVVLVRGQGQSADITVCIDRACAPS
jgi:hypothetical protein